MADLNPAEQAGPSHPPVSTYEFGRFRIDVSAKHLLRDGDVMLLTSKAFETLLLLVSHQDRVVTKDELMQAVWPNTFVSDDSLTQAISSVRRALGDAEFIATIPRRGYKFIVPVTEIAPSSTPSATPEDNGHAEPVVSNAPLHSGEHAVDVLVERPVTNRKWMSAVLVLAGVAAGVVLGRSVVSRGAADTAPTPLRFTQEAPPGTRIVSGGVLSPDGRYLAFIASDVQSGIARIWVRPLASSDSRALAGTENAERPFWSPDSQSLGFVANGRLKTVSLNGADAHNLAAVRSFAGGAAWGPNVILFSNWRAGLDAVAPWGGATSPMTTLDPAGGEVQHRSPQFLPDGRHYVFYLAAARVERAGVYLGTTGSSERIRLLDGTNEAPIYAPPGYLLYVRDGALIAQRFDLKRLRLEGEPTTLASHVSAPTNRNSAALSVAGGLLAFGGGTSARRLAWFDRRGDRLSTIQTPTALHSPVISSDGKRLLAQSFEADNSGIWLLDLEREATNRIVPDGSMPMLSPDGNTLVFGSYRGTGVFDLFSRRVSGKNEDMPLLHTNENKFVNDWTRDGRYILFASSNAKTGEDMWLLPTFGDRQPTPYLRSEFNEIQSRVSPDGRWVAYSSNESGAWEVYVQSFPIAGAKQVISVRGGAEPVWRSDGHELYYLAADRTLMAVEIASSGDTLKIGRPVALFRPPVSGSLNVFRSHYAVTPDGKRFVIDTADSESAQESITVISNWTALLGR